MYKRIRCVQIKNYTKIKNSKNQKERNMKIYENAHFININKMYPLHETANLFYLYRFIPSLFISCVLGNYILKYKGKRYSKLYFKIIFHKK